MNMDYLSSMMSSPVYEFPYAGSYGSSAPFFNYDPNLLSSVSMINSIDF
jgi:hypothetical protein